METDQQPVRDRLVILGANGMAGFLDFSVGTLIIGFLSVLFEVHTPIHIVLLGALLALLPDVDLIPSVLRGRSAHFDHRQTIFHRPLVVMPVATFVGYSLGGQFWCWAVFISVLWHYLHDTGWVNDTEGVAWLWPLSKSYWSWWGRYSVSNPMEHHTWLRMYWLKPSLHSACEVGAGLLFLFLGLQLAEVGFGLSIIMVSAVAAGVSGVWYFAKLLPNSQNTL